MHDSETGLVQHMVMSNDHPSETRGEAWREVLRDESHDGPTEADATDGDETDATQPDATPDAPEPAETDGGTETNPVVDGPDPDPTEDDSEEPTCPNCGGNRYFDASEHTDYDFGCPDCSTEGEWEVWNE